MTRSVLPDRGSRLSKAPSLRTAGLAGTLVAAAVLDGALEAIRSWISRKRGAPTPPRAPRTTGYRAVLAKRDLRLLFGGVVISFTGSWAYNVALLVFVFDRTHSSPALLFSAYGGVLADRFERVRLMVCSDLLCLGWQAGLAVVAALDGPVEVAIALAALTAVSNVVYQPAVAATLPELAGEDLLVAANAINGTIENLGIVLGPAIGAVLVTLGSPALTFAFDGPAARVSRMRSPEAPPGGTDTGRAQTTEGRR